MIRGRVLEVLLPVAVKRAATSSDNTSVRGLPDVLRFSVDEHVRRRLLMLSQAVLDFKQTTKEQRVRITIPDLIVSEWLFDIAASSRNHEYVNFDQHPYKEVCVATGRGCNVTFADEAIIVTGNAGDASWATSSLKIADIEAAWKTKKSILEIKVSD